MKLTPLVFVLLCACRVVAGTEDLFLCGEEKQCPEGGGVPTGGGSGQGGGAGECSDGQLPVEITVAGPIVVKIDSTGEELTAGIHERCLASGEERLRAECINESNASVSWSNKACPEAGDTCDFTLTEAEIFVVDGASACE